MKQRFDGFLWAKQHAHDYQDQSVSTETLNHNQVINDIQLEWQWFLSCGSMGCMQYS